MNISILIFTLIFYLHFRVFRNTTHLVFKEGKRATYNKAKKMGIPIVTVLWIEECRKVKRVVDPELFKISDWLKYENPEYYRRLQVIDFAISVIS